MHNRGLSPHSTANQHVALGVTKNQPVELTVTILTKWDHLWVAALGYLLHHSWGRFHKEFGDQGSD